ncbi:MAG: cbb3-type cytochrome c oxidase subunit I [Acidimicrobiales bacterium]|nr:cbb3-type cytochrome c oxidase subunit I [Acidimicrobiales bacterium]
MTVTDTEAPPAVTSAAPALAPPRPATGFAALIGTGDHRTIGRLYIGTSFLFLLASGVAGLLLGAERLDTSGVDVVGVDAVAEVFGIHAVAGVFLFLLPLLIGLAIAVVPAQVGARTIAFPRAAAASYWTYLIGGGIVLASFAADGGIGGTDADTVALFLAAMIVVLASLSLAAICIATTGLALRTEGMSLRRTPLFTWSNVVAAGIWLVTLPVLAAILLLAYVDVKYGPTFLAGGDQLYLRISWAWSQPTVYMYAIPVLGIVGDIVPVAARTRLTQHRIALGCIGAFAALSFGAWAMPGFNPSLDGPLDLAYTDEVPFVAVSILILLPLLAMAGLVADTIRKGTARLVSPLVWGLAALVMLLAGAANGALVSIDPIDLINTTGQSAQTHYVLGAATLGLLGGIVYWAPVLYGRRFPEGPSTALAAGGLLGTIVLALPELIAGLLDQGALLGGPAADASSGDVDAIEALNIVSLLGGAILALVALGFVGLLLKTATARRDGEGEAESDPWEGHTLEWAGDEPPAITSEAPVYDARHAEVSS